MRPITPFLAAAAVLLPAPPAVAKGDVRARLTAPLPVDAAPGRVVTVAWTLRYAEDGRRHPFGARDIFARVPGHGRVAATELGPGRYAARVRVPPEGLRALQIGLEGMRFWAGHSKPADMLFPVDAPRRAPSAGAGAPATAWIAPPLAAAALLGAALRRRRRALRGSGPRALP